MQLEPRSCSETEAEAVQIDLSHGQDLVAVTRFCEEYACRSVLPRLSPQDREPDLVFIGRTDSLSEAWPCPMMTSEAK